MDKKEKNVLDLILDELGKQERDLAWLSRKTEIPYGTIYSIFTHRLFKLKQDKLNSINEALGTQFSL